ncbi:MAG: hypothetical protein C0408_00875 [Odoribacter sp.]|nr:hypothetical protein [Odoribacter sp.]
MKPDRTNYEIWLIDYLDGTLDETRVNLLISFMDENPDIREEFEALKHYKIMPEDYSFPDKKILKRSFSDLSETQFELLCVASSENDLSEQQREELMAFTYENTDKKKTLELINRLKLVAPELIFNRKSSLRKLTTAGKVVRLSVIGLSAAAGIAIMISLFGLPENINDVLNPLSSINIAGDSIKVNARINIVADNPNAGQKKETIIAGNIKALSLLQRNISEEMKAIPVKTADTDSSLMKTELRFVNISKIDFMPEVILAKNELTATLAAIITTEIQSTDESEKQGFNVFIAKTFREKILRSGASETGSLKAYEIADAGINGLNKLLGWQMSLQKTRDEKGELKSLYFSSKILKFNAPVKKAQLGS